MRRRTYLIQDPVGEYALEFIRRIKISYGLRPVCFYTDRKARYYGEHTHPVLTQDVEAAYDLEDFPTLDAFVDHVRERYDIVAVVPHTEVTVGMAADLCQLLDIDWNPGDTVRRFRDKAAQKEQLAGCGLRVPFCRRVGDVDEIYEGTVPERFVLKPNDGYGNKGIGVFHAEEREAVRAHIERFPGTAWLLEEFIGGQEFNINGLVRSDGRVLIVGMFEYTRASCNGYQTVYAIEVQCPSSHPQFNTLANYTEKLLEATEIRRSPFHLEVKVDDWGPCMIDLAARFAGYGAVQTMSRSHPGLPDLFAIATADYMGVNDLAAAPVDWAEHDRNLSFLVYGIATEGAVIQSLSGCREIEGLPEFVTWLVKPSIGQWVVPTTELATAPYIVELRQRATEDENLALARTVRDSISWNAKPTRLGHASAILRTKADRAPRKLGWLVHEARRRVSARRAGRP